MLIDLAELNLRKTQENRKIKQNQKTKTREKLKIKTKEKPGKPEIENGNQKYIRVFHFFESTRS